MFIVYYFLFIGCIFFKSRKLYILIINLIKNLINIQTLETIIQYFQLNDYYIL